MIENWKGVAYIDLKRMAKVMKFTIQDLKKLYQSKRDIMLEKQYALIDRIRQSTPINVVSCGQCGQMLLHNTWE